MVLRVNEDTDTLWKFIISKIDTEGNPIDKPLTQITYEVDSNIPAACTINSILMSQLKNRMAQLNESTNK